MKNHPLASMSTVTAALHVFVVEFETSERENVEIQIVAFKM
jgi:hypothetical protein